MRKMILITTAVLLLGLGLVRLEVVAQDAAAESRSDEALANQADRTDRYGDPLPEGAIARLGTVRLRHSDPVNSVAFSPDGTLLASSGWDRIRLWDVRTGKPIRTLGDRNSFAAVFSPDGEKLASVGDGGRVQLWDVRSGEELFRAQKHKGRTHGIAFTPDGNMFATAGGDGTIRLWDVASGEELLALQINERTRYSRYTMAVAFSPDGRRLAAGGWTTIRIWDLEAGGAPIVIEDAHGRELMSLTFTSDGQRLLSAGSSKRKTHVNDAGERVRSGYSELRMWDADTGERIRELSGGEPDHWGCTLALSANGRVLASVHRDRLRIWNPDSGKLVRTIEEYRNYQGWGAHGIALSPKGRTLAVCGPNSAVQLYDAETGQRLLPFAESHEGNVRSQAVSPSGKLLATGGEDGTLRLWDLKSGRQVRVSRLDERGSINSVAFSPDGQFVAAGGYGKGYHGLVVLWNVETGEPVWQADRDDRIMAVAFSPKGDKLAAAAGMGAASHKSFSLPGEEVVPSAITLWDVASGKELRKLEGPEGAIRWLAFAEDGRTLTGADDKGTIRRWDLAEGRELMKLETPNVAMRGVAFSPDLRFAATGALFSERLVLWNLESEKPVQTIATKKGSGHTLAYSPDGRWLVSGRTERTSSPGRRPQARIRLRDASSGEVVAVLNPEAEFVSSLTFTPDGKHLISSQNNGTVLIWDLEKLVAGDADR